MSDYSSADKAFTEAVAIALFERRHININKRAGAVNSTPWVDDLNPSVFLHQTEIQGSTGRTSAEVPDYAELTRQFSVYPELIAQMTHDGTGKLVGLTVSIVSTRTKANVFDSLALLQRINEAVLDVRPELNKHPA